METLLRQSINQSHPENFLKKSINALRFSLALTIAALSLLVACEISTGAGEDGFGYEPKGFTVTFNSKGGSPVSPITGVQLYSTISPPANPFKGYVFVGWYKDAALTQEWNFTTDIVIGNITLYAKWGAYDGSLLNVGDTGPGGGIIFYKNATAQTMTDYGDFHYLEAAPNDMPTALSWQSSTTSSISGTEEDIGRGRKNTALIVADNSTTPAADACYNYRHDGQNDWFLPSKDELNQLYLNRSYVGNLDTGSYWSSSEYDPNYAWDQRFSGGNQYDYTKTSANSVRAVRAF